MLMPLKYNAKIAVDIIICVTGSVEGVNIAPKIVDITIMYFHADNIFFDEIIFMRPNTICNIGI